MVAGARRRQVTGFDGLMPSPVAVSDPGETTGWSRDDAVSPEACQAFFLALGLVGPAENLI